MFSRRQVFFLAKVIKQYSIADELVNPTFLLELQSFAKHLDAIPAFCRVPRLFLCILPPCHDYCRCHRSDVGASSLKLSFITLHSTLLVHINL